QQERQQRREARGRRQGQEANQARILLGRQKERSEASAGRLRRQQADTREALDQRVREAARQIDLQAGIRMQAPPPAGAPCDVVALLDDVLLPFSVSAGPRLNLSLYGGQRLAVAGPNGCGKTRLLDVLSGRLAPQAGE
ncbi:ATP-binding cassette domain-containing protein, partial [Burkholderia sola]|uniref:ATP-binding cassette domain-containing protein n=1 Tax=Burkholderia sola TaxID=2843302 RepID=UPI0033900D75